MTKKMRWDCEKQGCFNTKCRPKIEIFNDCFPGNIGFGDVDAWSDNRGSFCMLEWKGDGGRLELAQEIAFTNFTKIMPRSIVFVVHGDAETMEVYGYSFFWKGLNTPHIKSNLDALKVHIKKWADWCLKDKLAA
jgi:hypothetical protein